MAGKGTDISSNQHREDEGQNSRHQVQLLFNCKYQEEFIHLFNKYKTSGRNLYFHVLDELNRAIQIADIEKLKECHRVIVFMNTVLDTETLQEYFLSNDNPIKHTTVIIIACKHCQINSLEYFLSSERAFVNFSLNIGRSTCIVPTDEDEECHNAVYYAIRTDNVALFETLTQQWKRDLMSEKLDEIVSRAYEELKLKNVALSDDMEIFIERTLINYRFFSADTNQTVCAQSSNNTQDRMDLLLRNIQYLDTEYKDEKVDEKFFLVARYIVQNIHILKKELKWTYSLLPWEEMEFCLVAFIKSKKSSGEINLLYKCMLTKDIILIQLSNFADSLMKHRVIIENMDSRKMSQLPKLKRETVVADVLRKSPEFTDLYRIYEEIRDISSLDTIHNYTSLALSAESTRKNEQLLIIRILQVIGEYLKNTLESPKLSNATSELLLCSLQKDTRKIVCDLRNSLSHASSLSKRVELEETADINFFTSVLENIKCINEVIESILLEYKKKVLKSLLKKIIESENVDEIKEIVKTFQLATFDTITKQSDRSQNSFTNMYETISKLCEKMRNTVTKTTSYEDELFSQIRKVIHDERDEKCDMKTNYLMAFALLEGMHFLIVDSETFKNNIKTVKQTATRALENLSTPMKSHVNDIICENLIKIQSSISCRDHDENFYKARRLMYEIFFTLKFETGNIKWIEELNDELNVIKHKDNSVQRQTYKCLNSTEGMRNYLTQRVEMLKDILQKSKLQDQLKVRIQYYKRNKILQAVTEMLVLDIYSILGDSEKRLINNNMMIDENFPSLIGKTLRNHLAHGNAMVDVLLCAASHAILLNALMLTTKDVISSGKKIGKVSEINVLELQKKVNQETLYVENQKLLFVALSKGDLDVTKSYIAKGADLHARNHYFQTSFHVAAMGPDLEVVKYVADQKINHQAKDVYGQTPLHVAARYGREGTIKYLIESKEMDVNDTDDADRTCLHLAAQYGCRDVVLMLLKHKARTACKDTRGLSPLHHAIRNNHEDIAIILLEREQHVDVNETAGGFTSLHIAAEIGNTKLVNFLLKSKANVNACSDAYVTPLHVATESGTQKVVESLISAGANVNAKNIYGSTPLHAAVQNGYEDIVKTIIDHGAIFNVYDKNYNNEPLHYAAQFGHKTIIEILLQKGANVNTVTSEGLTALHFAAENGHQEIVELLLINNNSSVNAETNQGTTALHYSAMKGYKDIAQHLIQMGAAVNARTRSNMTPLHLAVCKDMTDCVKLLIEKGANVNSIGDKNLTPLHLSSSKDIVNVLIANKACINAVCIKKMTALHYASIRGDSTIAEILIREGAQVNATEKYGQMPLHCAAMLGHKNVIEILIKNEADVHAKNHVNLTPIYFAVEANHKDAVDVLIHSGASINENFDESLLTIAIKNNNRDIVHALICKGVSLCALQNALTAAVVAGHKDLVNLLLNQQGINVNTFSISEMYLLHLAVAKGNKKIVQALLLKGAQVNVVSSVGNATPLHAAAESGDHEIVQMLLAHSANIDAKSADGSTALHIASGLGHNRAVQVLLKHKANMNIKDKKNRTCLELAVANGHLDIVVQIIEYQETGINAKGNDDFTLLHIAAQKGHLDVTKHLITCGADINSRNNAGSKPIHIAARDGHIDIMDFYLTCKVSMNDRGVADQTLLHYAAIGNQIAVAKHLMELNADVNMPDKNGSKPLHIAAALGYKEMVKYLLENGAHYDAVDNFYRKPVELTQSSNVLSLLTFNEELLKAARLGDHTKVEKCINDGAIVNVQNSKNASPLHYASYKGHNEVVGILLKHKANPNIIAQGGITPLHYACKFSHVEIVKCLLSNGAIYNPRNPKQKTPIDLAENKEIINLLNLIGCSFRNIENGNPNVINDLMKVKDKGIMKCVMNACNSESKTLIVSAIHNKFGLVKMLKEFLQESISTQMNIVEQYFMCAKYKEAANILEEILEKRRQILGCENPGTWDIEEHIALCIYKQNKYQAALILFQEIFKKQKEALGSDNKDTLHTQSFVALVLHRLGRDNEALSIFEEVYERQNTVLEKNDLHISETGGHMALVLDKLRRFDEALDISNDIFERKKEILGICHPATLSVQNNIAMILNNCDRYDESFKVYREVYEKRMVVLGPSHPDTLRTLHNSAGVLVCQEKYHQALELYNEVYQKQKIALGSDHKDTLNTQCNMAQLYFQQKKFLSAFKIYTETLDKRTAILGPNHPDILHTVMNIDIIKKTLQMAGEMSTINMKEDIFNAAFRGDENAVQTCIRNGISVNCKNEEGVTPLHIAVSNGHDRAVFLLLEHGADISVVSPKGNTALHIAVLKGYENIATELLKIAKQEKFSKLSDFVNVKTNVKGTTALHAAKDLQIVQLLLKHGAFYNIKNHAGETPKDLSENPSIIKLFSLIDILYEDAKSGNQDIINKLENMVHEERFAITNTRNISGKSLMQVLIMNQHRTLANKLLQIIK